MRIKITLGDLILEADFYDNSTAKAIFETLPLEKPYNTWGDEIYFVIPLECEVENGREIVELGDIAYWPPGNAFCLFYGKTPASTDDRPRAASEVTLIGKIDGDATQLKSAKGKTIKIESCED